MSESAHNSDEVATWISATTFVVALTLGAPALASCGYEVRFGHQQTTHTSEQMVEVDIDSAPKSLPPAVQAAASRVIAISISDPNTNRDRRDYSVGSGIIIDDYTAITAGHVLNQDNGESRSTTQCGSLQFEWKSGPQKYWLQPVIKSFSGTNRPNMFPDIGLLNYKRGADSLLPRGRVAIAAKVPQPGQALSFVNYQTDASGRPRNPAEALAGTDAHGNPLTSSVDYPGIFLRQELPKLGGLYDVILPGGKGYVDGDSDSRPGASGGPVFTNDGQLVGITRGIYISGKNTEWYSKERIREIFGVELAGKGVAPNSQYHVARVQPVSEGMIANQMKDLNSAKEVC